MSQRIQNSSTDISESNSMLPYLSKQLQRVIEKTINERYSLIEDRLNILATISSAAPFIGLFGTVLGIINSFQSIGTTGVTSLASVAPGISEALVATAAGLLAAIPALMAYNYFRNHARLLSNTMRNFGMELTNRFEWIVNGRLLGRE
jgi:biopolymer transport protein TolQ